MQTNNALKLEPKYRFLYWITEREKIRENRILGLPKPWTNDEILQQYRFTNVRRMDDRVSHWLYVNWYEAYKDHPNMLTAVTLARQLNRIESLEAIGFPKKWDANKAYNILHDRQKKGLKNFSAAYMITGTLGGNKMEQIIHKVVTPIHKARLKLDTGSMQNTWKSLLPFAGFSSFISGQVVADLRWAVTGDWSDKDEWAPMGPGSKRGINRLLGNPVDANMTQVEFSRRLGSVIQLCKDNLPEDITSRMEAIDYQNCLCEFDKYTRALGGEGRPKQKYNGV